MGGSIFDLASKIQAVTSVRAVSTAATVTGEIVDLQNAEALAVVLNVGALVGVDADNYLTLTVEVGDVAAGTDMAAVASTDYVNPQTESGATWDRLINASGEANASYSVGIRPQGKRYARVVLTETSAITSALVAASIIKSSLRQAPLA